MNKPGLYILQCKNNRYYVGSTNNFSRRIQEHKNGLVKSTKNILPVKVAFFQKCSSVIEARRLEYLLKQKKSREIIEKIIKDGCIKFTRA